MKPKIIVIVGPTAVGKTALSIEVAKSFNGEIIGADSIQVYKGLDIGSAKVTEQEKQGITHHLIDVVNIEDQFSAGDYVTKATQCIKDIISRGKTPIIVGGTGMYVQSLLFPLGVTCGKDQDYRDYLDDIANKEGTSFLHNMLKEVDPESASQIHPNHKPRIIRALEIFHLTGNKKSQMKSSQESPYDYILIGLNTDREVLYNRINLRVDKMLESGLLKEVQNLINQGMTETNQCLQGIGYKEVYTYLTQQCNYEDFVEKLKQNSRNYAKRQLTWFRKMPNIQWFEYTQKEQILNKIGEFING